MHIHHTFFDVFFCVWIKMCDVSAKKCINAGASNLVAGSYIFNNDKKEYLNKVDLLR